MSSIILVSSVSLRRTTFSLLLSFPGSAISLFSKHVQKRISSLKMYYWFLVTINSLLYKQFSFKLIKIPLKYTDSPHKLIEGLLLIFDQFFISSWKSVLLCCWGWCRCNTSLSLRGRLFSVLSVVYLSLFLGFIGARQWLSKLDILFHFRFSLPLKYVIMLSYQSG